MAQGAAKVKSVDVLELASEEPGPHAQVFTSPSGLHLIVVFVGALIVYSWRVAAPSPWRDEAVSYLMAGRSFGQILATTDRVDLVHRGYYLLGHVLRVAGIDFVGLRLVSVIAFAAAVAVTVLLGRDLLSLRAGLLAGAFVVVTPIASAYAQQARPYALTTLAASYSTWRLVRASRGNCRRSWVHYAITVVLCGLANAISLLVLVSHALLVLVVAKDRKRLWFVSVGAAISALTPFLVLAFRQRGQVAWLVRPGADQLVSALTFQWPERSVVAALGVVFVVTALRAVATRAAVAVFAAWGFMPVVILWMVSQVHPLFDGRYLVFCLPGTSLAVASGAEVLLRRQRPTVAVSLLVALVMALGYLGWPAQVTMRRQDGVENLRGVANVLHAHAAPGDAVVFLPTNFRLVMLMYPQETSALQDLTLGEEASQSATLVGSDRAPDEVAAAIRGQHTLWLVTRRIGATNSDRLEQGANALISACFRPAESWEVGGFAVLHLYAVPRGRSTPHDVSCSVGQNDR